MNGNNGHLPHLQETQERRQEHDEEGYRVLVPKRFIIRSLMASCLLAFCVGRAARHLLSESRDQSKEEALIHFPEEQSKAPRTYLSQTFDVPQKASSSSFLLDVRDTITLIAEENPGEIGTNGEKECYECNEEEEDDEENEAVAEHLMVDIKNVDSSFLNSERRLASALLELVSEAKLTLLSYHCNGLVPVGVSCVGLLKRNYLSLHTWPEKGVITLDVCVGGSSSVSLLPVLSIVERVFGVPQTAPFSGASVQKPVVKWAHKLRGFDIDESINDLSIYVLNNLGSDIKREVFSVDTNFQKIDIVEYEWNGKQLARLNSLFCKGLYEPTSPLNLRPDRIVLLDGWIQSTLFHEAAYHEALVHPGMFAQSNPKRVAIIGGGEGATLREVLKHNTVEEAIMVEIDKMMVNVSREYLPEWSDCSDLVDSTPWCIEDSRASVYYEDALVWFLDRYRDVKNTTEPIDVVIMDALDPESEIPFSMALYSDKSLMEAFYNSLSSDGVLVMQLGESPELHYSDETRNKFKNRAEMERLLEEVGFESVHVYEESHCDYGASWEFLVAFKSYGTRRRWYANTAEVELAIQKRGIRTKSGESPFRYFDGASMASYQVPPRTVENVFCRRQPSPLSCTNDEYILDPEHPNVPVSLLEVKASTVGENAGRGLFTKVDILKDSFIGGEVAGDIVRFFPFTRKVIDGLYETCDAAEKRLEAVEYYMDGYGFTSQKFGDLEVFVDSSILTFANHGCNGTYNSGKVTEVNELTADPDAPIESLNGRIHTYSESLFDPVVDRHLLSCMDSSIRDIQAGEEILDNYLAFIGDEGFWANDLRVLRRECSGEATPTEGSVTEYEEYYVKTK